MLDQVIRLNTILRTAVTRPRSARTSTGDKKDTVKSTGPAVNTKTLCVEVH